MLGFCGKRLRELADEGHEQVTPPIDQQAAEYAVAVGIAELAGEPRPGEPTELPERPILAKDLLITVDLVLRSLIAQETA